MLINFVDATNDANHYTKPLPVCNTESPVFDPNVKKNMGGVGKVFVSERSSLKVKLLDFITFNSTCFLMLVFDMKN